MPFLPPMNQVVTARKGPQGIPPNGVIFTSIPCGYWLSRGRQGERASPGDPLITGQVALGQAYTASPIAWSGSPPVFNYSKADVLTITTAGVANSTVLAVSSAPMWAGLPEYHWRVNVCPVNLTSTPTAPPHPIGRTDGRPVTFSILRPFGGATVSAGNIGTLYADLPAGRGGFSGGNYLPWTDFVDTSDTVDVRDGVLRAGGLDTIVYSDGDEVLITNPATATAYAVVMVQRIIDLNGSLFKRAYLTRDHPGWPGP